MSTGATFCLNNRRRYQTYASLSGMYCKAITCVIVLTTVLDLSVDSIIVQRPSDTTAMVNESTYFNCSTSMRPVNERSIRWFHYPLDGGGDRKYVSDGGRILTNYMNRFAIEKELSSGAFNLLALRVEPEDAGRYECKDDIHEANGASAELTVLGSDLVCESDLHPGEIVGPTQCDNSTTRDRLQLSCSVTYNGKNAPHMEWINNEGLSFLNKTDCVTKDNRVTCYTSIPSNRQLNRSVYYCESITQKYNCSLEISNALYAFVNTANGEYHTGDEVTCVANASRQLPCSYKWFQNNTTVSSHPTFKPNNPGLHRCQAQCEIRGDSCTFTVMVINVSTVSDPSTNLRYYWLCMLLLIAGVGLILGMLYKRNWLSRCLCNKKIRNPPDDINVEHQLQIPLTGAENPMQQNEQKTAASSNSPSNQLKDTANMTANAKNGEEIQNKTILNETNEDSNAKELNAERTTGETIADETIIDIELIVGQEARLSVDDTLEERNPEYGNEIIKRLRDFLELFMDPDSGLLDTLRAKETLSWREVLEVKDKSPFCKRNSLLLDHILEKHQYSGLISALQENEQLHIVNYLNANAEYRPIYEEEWPLSAKELKILNANQKGLLRLLDLSVLLSRLHSSKVINQGQLESITSKLTSSSKNEAMLDILRRRSLRDYHQTIKCLRQVHQHPIADVLESGGVIAEVHANLDEPSENVDVMEDEISTRFANSLNGISFVESIKILELAKFKVIAAQKGGCVVLYIWCDAEKELLRLFDLHKSGRLKDDTEQLFNHLLAPSKQVAVKNITMIDEDCERMKAYFRVRDSQFRISDGCPGVQVMPYTLATRQISVPS